MPSYALADLELARPADISSAVLTHPPDRKSVQVTVIVKSPRMKERAINTKMLKEANLLSRQLRSINRLDAIVVIRPKCADWDEMEVTPTCCGCSYKSASVSLPPFEQPVGSLMPGNSAKVAPEDASPQPTGKFVAGHLHVYLRGCTVPSQLSTMSLSPSVDPNRDDCTDYAVGELARFGVMQSLPLGSRLATLRHAMRAVAQDELTVRLVVLSLLGDAAVEMVRALDRAAAGAPKSSQRPAIDAVDTRTWHTLLQCAEQADHELRMLSGTPHAQKLVSGLAAMASFLRPKQSKDCAFFAALAKQVATALNTATEPTVLMRYAAELKAAKAQISQTSKLKVSAEKKGGLAFVVPDFHNLGAGALPWKRSKRIGAALRKRSATSAVLWRFSSAGVAAHDALMGCGGGEVIHVRDSAVLSSVEVVSGSKFSALTQQAHRKQHLGMRTRSRNQQQPPKLTASPLNALSPPSLLPSRVPPYQPSSGSTSSSAIAKSPSSAPVPTRPKASLRCRPTPMSPPQERFSRRWPSRMRRPMPSRWWSRWLYRWHCR